MLAAASPLLRVLLLEEEGRGDEVQELCCPELEPKQAFQLLQFIYQGQVEGLEVSAAEEICTTHTSIISHLAPTSP